MKGFWKRMSYYLFGITLGSILVFLMFGNRSCSWTPSHRIKATLNRKLIVFPENQIEALQAIGITGANIHNYLLKGSIDFPNSIKELGVYPKVYVFKKSDTLQERLQFSYYEDSYITVVHLINKDEEPKQYGELEGWGKIMHIPKDSALVFIDKSDYLKCKASGLASQDTREITQAIKETGRINFSKSDLMLVKAKQQLYFTQNDTLEVEAETIWFQDRITFKDFIWNHKLECEDE